MERIGGGRARFERGSVQEEVIMHSPASLPLLPSIIVGLVNLLHEYFKSSRDGYRVDGLTRTDWGG